MAEATSATREPASTGYRSYVLFILVVVYTFNFLDRQIIGILAPPIQEELGLSDTELGLMGGLAFAVLYSTLGVPIAWLADRVRRVWIMGAALTVWSGMTALCGFTHNFWQLFAARVGVGVGEAGGVAPAYSLIADYFPPRQRARALAIYSFGIPIGSAIGIVFGGVIAALIDWRAAFMIVGALGVVVAPVFLLTVREPQRGGHDSALAPARAASIGDVFKVISRKPSFWFLSVGAACSSMMGYGLFFWIPGFVIRSYGDALPEFFSWAPSWLVPENPSLVLLAGYFYGAIVLIGGLIGIGLGGVLGDALGGKRKANYALIPAVAFLITTPLFIAGVLSPSLAAAFVIFLFPTALGLMWLGPVVNAFQHLAPPHMRTTASSIFLLINNLLGIGGGIYALGALSDALAAQFGDESLRYAILAGSGLYLVAAVLLLLAARRLDRDWVE